MTFSAVVRGTLLSLLLASCRGSSGRAITMQIATIEDLGAMPLPSARTIGRDGGDGGEIGGKLLWTFGDTFTTGSNPVDHSSVLSATSGWSSLGDPLGLVQPTDAEGFPAQLVPYTEAELAANRADPLNGWALWPGAIIDTGAPQGLLVFQRIKRINGSGFEGQGVATARLAVDGTVATRDGIDLFAPPEPLFLPGSVIDGEVYAFACSAAGPLNFACKVGRASVDRADQRAAYEFFDGLSWQGDVARAAVLIDHATGGGLSLSKNPHLGRYLVTYGALLSSTVVLRTADRIEGPWSDPLEIQPDGVGYLAATSAPGYNYLVREHPELRSGDGKSIVVSYSRPTAPFRGDVRLMRVTFR